MAVMWWKIGLAAYGVGLFLAVAVCKASARAEAEVIRLHQERRAQQAVDAEFIRIVQRNN